MHFWTWLSAMYQAEAGGTLQVEIEEIQEAFAHLRNYEDPNVASPQNRPRSRFGAGRQIYALYGEEVTYHTHLLAHHPTDLVAMELAPAMNIAAGMVRLAWMKAPNDPSRVRRIVKNSAQLILDWSTIGAVAFSLVRATLIDRSSALMLPTALKLENEGKGNAVEGLLMACCDSFAHYRSRIQT